MNTEARLLPAGSELEFAYGGNATFTLKSLKTGVHFTYRVKKAEERPGDGAWGPSWFVSLLSGPDNESDYAYLGLLKEGAQFRLTRKSRAGDDAPSVKALRFFLAQPTHAGIEVWHEGRCCVCNRKLTVPESIESGIGPVCAGR